MAHRIRLRKPWTRLDHSSAAPVTSASSMGPNEENTSQVDVPDLSGDDAGSLDGSSSSGEIAETIVQRVSYVRRFNRPSGIESGERVELELGEVTGRLEDVRVNSQSLFDDADHHVKSMRFDVTDRLSNHNELEIQIHGDGLLPRLTGAVNLWIVTPE
ncbi:hypothetical protein FHS27_001811 [Rhodopirellula rubra]|uniref:Uncharacterized protein n=1 Tax=Aporhodopirellula rubra TaxID=980271 RepID=A0A7W5H593_9BACT|nr:hypothetical protein [Aporhodopirellula rubra]MBB3206003.1 hypothetical protein [Aporhodopirellula rubra]